MAITRSQIARQLLQQGGVSMVDPRMKRSLQENIARNEIQRELSSAVRSGNFRDFLLKNVEHLKRHDLELCMVDLVDKVHLQELINL